MVCICKDIYIYDLIYIYSRTYIHTYTHIYIYILSLYKGYMGLVYGIYGTYVGIYLTCLWAIQGGSDIRGTFIGSTKLRLVFWGHLGSILESPCGLHRALFGI